MAEKDENIANELGHTYYPKWVDHPTETIDVDAKVNPTQAGKVVPKRVIVNNKEEEDALLGEKNSKSKANKPKGWEE